MHRKTNRLIGLSIALALPLLVACGDDDDANDFDTEIRSEQIAANGFVFDVRIAGNEGRPPVILLHGFPETSYQWRHQLEDLAAEGYLAIAPDQRGYSTGARPSEVADYAIPFLIADVLGIADEMGIDQFHLVGHDWGAGVAWSIAAGAPGRLRSLSILSIPHPDAFAAELGDPESCQYDASSYVDIFSRPGAAGIFLANDAALLRNQLYDGFEQAAIDEYIRVLTEPGAMAGALHWYGANWSDRSRLGPSIGPITTPTMLIWSDEDFAICPEGARNTGNYIEGPYEFIELNGVDHWITERVPNEVSQLLLRHLERY